MLEVLYVGLFIAPLVIAGLMQTYPIATSTFTGLGLVYVGGFALLSFGMMPLMIPAAIAIGAGLILIGIGGAIKAFRP